MDKSRIKGLLIPVGEQAGQIKVLIEELNPEYVGLIYTNTPNSINTKEEVRRILDGRGNVKVVEEREIEDRPEELSRQVLAVKELYENLSSKGAKRDEIVVDITGGRKWMATAMVLFGYILDLQMVYVHRDNATGRSRLIGLNPNDAWILEEDRAKRFFDSGMFDRALEIYSKVEDLVASEVLKEMRYRYAKSGILDALYRFDFEGANNFYKKLLSYANSYRDYGIKERFEAGIGKWLRGLFTFSTKDKSGQIEALKDFETYRALYILFEIHRKIAEKRNNYPVLILLGL